MGMTVSRPRSGATEVVENDVAAFAGQTPSVLFQGYDSVRGKVRSIAVKGETQISGRSNAVNYQICSDMEMVRQALDLNLSLSFCAEIFGQKLNFVNNLNLTTYTTCIVVCATNVTMEAVVNVNSLDMPTDHKDFFNGYGDSFVSKTSRGAEYCAVFLYNCETQEQQRKLMSEMSGQDIYAVPVLAGDVSLQKRLNNFNISQKTRLLFHQRVSGMVDVALPSAENVIEFALQFPSMVVSQPEVTHFEITGYENVPGMNSNMLRKIASNRDFICGQLRSALSRLQQLQKNIFSIEEIYKFYAGTGACYIDAKLMEVKRETRKDVVMVWKIIKEYMADPVKNHVNMNIKFGSLQNGTPSLHYAIHKSPRFGGNGGNAFNDIGVVDDYLHGLTRISRLQLRTGNAVSLLSVTYTSEKSKQLSKVDNGTYNVLSGHWPTSEMLIPRGVFVVSVSGSYKSTLLTGPVIENLRIQLSDGQFISGGPERGTPFHWEVPQGWFVLGFTGRFYWHVDQLEIVYASFNPAYWNHN